MAAAPAPSRSRSTSRRRQLDDLRDRLRRTRWAADYANDDWRYGTNGAWLQSTRRLLARRLRLAGPRGGHERLPALPRRARRRPDPLHPRRGQGPDARCRSSSPTAGRGRSGTSTPSSARSSDPAALRRRPRRRLRRRRAVAARASASPRRSPCPASTRRDRRPVGRAHARGARLRPLRRPGRRLGRDRHRLPRPSLRRAPHRHPPQLPGAARRRLPHGAAPRTTGRARRSGTSGCTSA